MQYFPSIGLNRFRISLRFFSQQKFLLNCCRKLFCVFFYLLPLQNTYSSSFFFVIYRQNSFPFKFSNHFRTLLVFWFKIHIVLITMFFVIIHNAKRTFKKNPVSLFTSVCFVCSSCSFFFCSFTFDDKSLITIINLNSIQLDLLHFFLI